MVDKILLLVFLSMMVTCKLYDEPITLIESKCPINEVKVLIKRSPSSATVEKNIHVKKIISNIEEVVCSFEHYDTIKFYYFKHDTLFLTLDDTENKLQPHLVQCIVSRN